MDGSAAELRFVRRRRPYPGYETIPFAEMAREFHALAGAHRQVEAAAAAEAAESAEPRRSAAYRWVRQQTRRLPDRVRAPLTEAYYHQRSAVAAAVRLARAVLRPRAAEAAAAADAAPAGEPTMEPADTVAGEFERDVRPGDVLLLLGAAWFPGYAAEVRDVVRRERMRLVLLIHDVVPLRRPEWCDPATIAPFAAWVHELVPLADRVLTVSRATASELARYATSADLLLRRAPCPIPVGTGFTGDATAMDAATPVARADLPARGSYALIVSTIEARKNHALLFRVWRRLLEDLPAERVPTLLFAGRVGWLVGDLMTQLISTGFLGGKIVLLETPSDADLHALYDGCLFTLFPSFYEGWGLPVTESLSFGRPCIISDTTSLPEAGGALARYFDPENGADAYRVIRAAIEDPDDLVAWRAHIAREFRPVLWEASARAIVEALREGGPSGAPELGMTA
jgi:glycosyltransferase involved in cell wall biosynthesis